jgi:Lon protease-like protein
MVFELPLFPLNVVLFPGMRLPLHIFEPRYRLMIRRCLENDQPFGVAMIVEGQEGCPGTVPADIGCTAEILEVAPFPDGRMNLQCIGRRRFRVLSRREEDGYLIGNCEWVDDSISAQGTADQAERLQPLVLRYLTDLVHDTCASGTDFDQIEVPDDPYALTMWLAALMPLPCAQKQRLLEMTSTATRLDAEYSLLLRAAVIHRAFARHAECCQPAGWTQSLGSISRFMSLN